MLPFRSVVRQVSAAPSRQRALQRSPMQLRHKSDLEGNYQPPNATAGQAVDPRSSDAKPHRAFYGNFGMPLLKGFLVALLTYEVTYWSWLKLESLEIQRAKREEVKSLEGQVRQLIGANKGT